MQEFNPNQKNPLHVREAGHFGRLMLRHAMTAKLSSSCEVDEMPEPIVKAISEHLEEGAPDFRLEKESGFATYEINFGDNYPGASTIGYTNKIYKGVDKDKQHGKNYAVFAVSSLEDKEPVGLVIGDLSFNGPVEFWEYDSSEEGYLPIDLDHPTAWKLTYALCHPELEQQ